MDFEPVKRATAKNETRRQSPNKALSPASRARCSSDIVLGFRYAPPQALCLRPLRGLKKAVVSILFRRSSRFTPPRLSSWIVLLLSLCACSCVKLSQTISTNEGGQAPAAINARSQTNRININTASARDLEALPGVGNILAERILAHRTQYGPFRRTEHLMMVRGFSDHKFRAIRERVTVE
jgi:competence ComEA-like helix-hairpin-helix protein